MNKEDKQLGELELLKTDSVNYTFIYLGSVSNLKQVDDLEWRKDYEYLEYFGVAAERLTLKEISDQINKRYPNHIITVFVDGPLKGRIYQYGNYGDYWIDYGETIGYA